MQRVIKLRNWFAQSRKNRILFLAVIGCMAGIGAGYLYFHNPLKYPLPCLFHVITDCTVRDVEQGERATISCMEIF